MGKASVAVEQFGTLADGRVILSYLLDNGCGMQLKVLSYGGTVQSLIIPTANGPRDVVIGFTTPEGWVKEPYYGALIGRVGNRIAFGKFSLEGKDYALLTNNEPGGIPCALHGGAEGFNAKIWDCETFFEAGCPGVKLSLVAPDGDQGYPGTVKVEVRYLLTFDNTWRITYEATSDRTTPINLTQHAYFNLKGEGQGDVLDHSIQIFAQKYTPVNAGLIPTGELAPVAGTPFDFTQARKLGVDVDADNDQIRYGAGYDHNFVLDKTMPGAFACAARLEAPDGTAMEVWTTEPGMQVYTGNYIPDGLAGKTQPYVRRGGVALETQHFADSVNQPTFPSVWLKPGETFRSETEYRFPGQRCCCAGHQ